VKQRKRSYSRDRSYNKDNKKRRFNRDHKDRFNKKPRKIRDKYNINSIYYDFELNDNFN
jgi:hypothetical protein